MTFRNLEAKHSIAVLFVLAIGSTGYALLTPLSRTHCSAEQIADKRTVRDNTQHCQKHAGTSPRAEQVRRLPTQAKRTILRRRQVYAGTNRRQLAEDDGKPAFGTANGPLRYLQCSVSVGTNYHKGQLTDITIESVRPIEDARALPDSQRLHSNQKDKRILVFVHGFYVEFEEAIRRATQIAHELDYRGALFVYSWPSVFQMSQKGYVADIQVVHRSASAFLKFLNDLTSRYRKSEIQILAHSLGCRLVCKAISPQPSRTGVNQRTVGLPRLSHVVFAAPDVPTRRFETTYSSRLRRVSQRIAIYHSRNDSLLRLGSQYTGDGNRLGTTGPKQKPASTIESIDYTRLDGGLGGFGYHNLYRHDPAMIKDLRAVLRDSISPSNRLLLSPRPSAGKSGSLADRS